MLQKAFNKIDLILTSKICIYLLGYPLELNGKTLLLKTHIPKS